MLILLKQATIVDPSSAHNGKTLDILIENGQITAIEKQISKKDATVIQANDLHICTGLVDVGTQICDPGYEHREDMESTADAAAYGGITTVLAAPNTHPVVQSKAEVLYLQNNSKEFPVSFHSIAALSQDLKGEDITEMSDMHEVGALAFSDGKKSIQSAGLIMRALQYVKAFDGIIINHPHDKSIARKGQMHEGIVSTTLGLSGISALSENLMVKRDIELAEYADSRLHLYNISTKEAVAAVKEAKKKGLKVTASVAVMSIAFEDESLTTFDSNYKVLPPLREKEDRKALIKGLKDGTIDFITSGHTPWEKENKSLEFSYADFGVISLQTAFALSRTHLTNFTEEQLVKIWSSNARSIFNLPNATIEVGSQADLTLYQPNDVSTLTESNNQSKSNNTPLMGVALKGKIKGIVNKDQYLVF